MKTKILILGGSHFIGRNLVESLQYAGEYEISIFNRGQTNPNLFSSIGFIQGDRNDAEQAHLKKGAWEVIIDLSCYFPDHLEKTLANLPSSVKHYIFLSTCSVYNNNAVRSQLRTEEAKLLDCSKEEYFNEEPSSYGARKAECERILEKSGMAHSIFRPALVYGKYDTTDRFYYWPYQVKTENQILVPEGGLRTFSTTYVQDLVKMILASLQNKIPKSTYNAISHPKTSISRIIEGSKLQLSLNPEIIDVEASFLKENNIREWQDFPLWLNTDIFTFSNEKILRAINFKIIDFNISLEESFAFFRGLNWPRPVSGISEERLKKLKGNLPKKNQN